jgi:rRNA maturation protein Nop10
MSQLSHKIYIIKKKENEAKKCPACYRKTLVNGKCTRCGVSIKKDHFIVI